MATSLFTDIDPFIGVDGDGNVLPGPCVPNGLVRIGPDVVPPMPTHGYRSGSPVLHFSHTHVVGTGGGGRYGNVGVLPFLGDPAWHVPPVRVSDEAAVPGRYRCRLDERIDVECTALARVGLHRWRFPAGAAANLLLRAGAVLQNDQVPGGDDGTGLCTGGYIECSSPTALGGRGDFRGGWGHLQPYSVYFWLEWDVPTRSVRLGDALGCARVDPGRGAAHVGAGAIASLHFGPVPSLELRVGISLVSVAKARAAVRAIVGRTFAEVAAQAERAWAERLGGVRASGGSKAHRTLLATSLMRLNVMPTDLGIDDEHPYLCTGRRAFTDHYCLWDSVRGADSLRTLLAPDLHRDILADLLATADERGWLADADIAGHAARMQGASSAHLLFAEAARKGIPGIDYRRALARMRRDAEEASPDPFRLGRHPTDPARGWLPTGTVVNAVSRSLEYAEHDAAISALAAQVGERSVAEAYAARARRIWELWRDDLVGFAPRRADGTWLEPFDPTRPSTDCSWLDPNFYEGSSRMWTLTLLQQLPELVKRCGGAGGFADILDRFFAGLDRGEGSWKELVLHTPWLYLEAGRPDRCAQRVAHMLDTRYSTRRDGLPDNEDMGAHSAFLFGALTGLYAHVGTDSWWLAAPRFPEIEIDVAGGRVLRILTDGLDAAGSAPMVTAATLDGRPTGPKLRHQDLAGGGVVRVTVAPAR